MKWLLRKMRTFKQSQEFKMKNHRLFNIFVAIALIVLIGITVREVAATTAVVSLTDSSDEVCVSLPSHSSVHTEYVKEMGIWMTYTDEGPTGIDGGLIHLLSNSRNCSQ
jgi:hypothetical protein